LLLLLLCYAGVKRIMRDSFISVINRVGNQAELVRRSTYSVHISARYL
jgi:hypothetical protein